MIRSSKTTILSRQTVLLLILGLYTFSCRESPPEAAAIIQRCIAAHGGELYRACHISFDFRGKLYGITRGDSGFRYTRSFNDSSGSYSDELDNTGFRRLLNGEKLNLAAADSNLLANSLNSVVYFAVLPFPLADPAVQAQLLNSVSIKGRPYFELEVTFRRDGGGKDFEDRFIYWIHRELFTLDYLAYRFQVNGGGTRFREAFNIRTVNGIRLADYRNYRAVSDSSGIDDMDALLEQGALKQISEIVLENVAVTIK